MKYYDDVVVVDDGSTLWPSNDGNDKGRQTGFSFSLARLDEKVKRLWSLQAKAPEPKEVVQL